MTMPFIKMHGLGNDFVIVDARMRDFTPDLPLLQKLGDRRFGVGCDQIIVLRKAKDATAALMMDMFNSDGTKVNACGNATRCVASLVFDEMGSDSAIIETVMGLLPVTREQGLITVDFGAPRLQWQEIPLAHQTETLSVRLRPDLPAATCVSMGNPHAVIFVPDIAAIDLAALGPQLETLAIFPDRCNIEFAQVLAPARIRMRVWERGAGITLACGSGASATLVAAVRRGLADRRASIMMDGGEAIVSWDDKDNHVRLSGPAERVYDGVLSEKTLAMQAAAA